MHATPGLRRAPLPAALALSLVGLACGGGTSVNEDPGGAVGGDAPAPADAPVPSDPEPPALAASAAPGQPVDPAARAAAPPPASTPALVDTRPQEESSVERAHRRRDVVRGGEGIPAGRDPREDQMRQQEMLRQQWGWGSPWGRGGQFNRFFHGGGYFRSNTP
jgi:hypothetical protein